MTMTSATTRKIGRAAAVSLTLAMSGLLNMSNAWAPPLPGAVFTTNADCTGIGLNIYAAKGDVYIDGGPAFPGALGLPDGSYYVKVTDPGGAPVGQSPTAVVSVVGGEFVQCYRLTDILVKESDASPGYDDTDGSGGEYKVWISQSPALDQASSKTDNFKVLPDQVAQATLNVVKFYDANANGINDDAQPITGWQVRVEDGIEYVRATPTSVTVAPDTYTITEFAPVETNWISTTPNPVVLDLADGDATTVQFGNLCVGAGGGLTLGFWSNKNGQAQVGGDDLAMLRALNLRNAAGGAFDPANYAGLRTWLLNASAINMANMLSAQLATMELNVLNGGVSSSSLISAPGTASANVMGFAAIADLMAEAEASLVLNGNTAAAGPVRAAQEALKNALDAANNNRMFVQPAPCAFTFAAA
jgi:hypothetical protein